MKFGKNLEHLSLPEWKSYNIDYNELKSQIRRLTMGERGVTMAGLHQAFLDNFDYINLFILTKLGELQRKLAYLRDHLKRLSQSTDDLRHQLFDTDEIFTQGIDLLIVVKNLSKFIIVQKIALKKLFKKFVKYYKDKKAATSFILSLKNILASNPQSFLNIDLLAFTPELTSFLASVKLRQATLIDAIQGPRKLVGSISSSTVKPDPLRKRAILLAASRSHVLFDITVAVKKNFRMSFLMPNDSNTLADLELNLNVYLNFKTSLQTLRLIFIFLTCDTVPQEYPTYIVSAENEPTSLLVAYTGGLRNYAHCTLANSLVERMLTYLHTGKGKDEFRAELAKHSLTARDPLLTKRAIDCVLLSSAKPTLKMYCERLRYILKRNDEVVVDDDECDLLLASPYSDTASATSALLDFQDDFLITLDHNIRTTSDSTLVASLEQSGQRENQEGSNLSPTDVDEVSTDVDHFPHSHLAVFSNDSNLSTFINSIDTVVSEGQTSSAYDKLALRLLPQKLQNLVTNSPSVHLYKNFSMYQYMILCYSNVVPVSPLNHYSKVLALNLLKRFECIEKFNSLLNYELSVMRSKSSPALRRQLSFKSLYNAAEPPKHNSSISEAADRLSDIPKHNSTVSMASTRMSLASRLTNHNEDEDVLRPGYDVLALDDTTNSAEDDDYMALYMNAQRRADDSAFGDFIHSIIGVRKRIARGFWRFFGAQTDPQKQPLLPIHNTTNSYDFINTNGYDRLIMNKATNGYDSIYDEEPLFMHRKSTNIHTQYEEDYDQTLSYFYFTLNIILIFLSGLEFGIFYSIFLTADTTDSKMLINENLWLIVILVVGLLVSLVFSMIGISLNFLRYTDPPALHTGLVWGGFVIVCVCCIGSVAMVLSGI